MSSAPAHEGQTNLPPENIEDIAAFVQETLGNSDVVVEPFATRGYMTRVYTCQAGSAQYIVRHGMKGADFRRDQFVAHAFGEQLPVAPVRSVGKLSDKSYACLSDRLPGDPVDERLLATPGPVRQSFADTLAQLHAIDVDSTRGFGPAKENGNGVLPGALYGLSLRLMPGILGKITRRHTDIDHASFRDIATLHRSLGSPATSTLERRLSHGDLKADNLLSDGVTITGVIDWARFAYSDPALDLGILHVRHPGVIDAEKHIEIIGANPEHLKDRIMYYAIGECCVAITFFGQSGLRAKKLKLSGDYYKSLTRPRRSSYSYAVYGIITCYGAEF